jgi:hypothetical protein
MRDHPQESARAANPNYCVSQNTITYSSSWKSSLGLAALPLDVQKRWAFPPGQFQGSGLRPIPRGVAPTWKLGRFAAPNGHTIARRKALSRQGSSNHALRSCVPVSTERSVSSSRKQSSFGLRRQARRDAALGWRVRQKTSSTALCWRTEPKRRRRSALSAKSKESFGLRFENVQTPARGVAPTSKSGGAESRRLFAHLVAEPRNT